MKLYINSATPRFGLISTENVDSVSEECALLDIIEKRTKDSSENESKQCEKDAKAKSIFKGINFIKVIVLVSDIRQI